MKGEARKAATAAYKERKVASGVYAVRCMASGEVWLGQWVDLATIQNRLWFALRRDSHPKRELLESWRSHGEEQFSFEVLETLDDEPSPYIRAAKLKERAAHWRETLKAKPI
ncbi:GIY-YIG nuclease family protein [Rhodoblastus acidophilus]|uniref:GIY-YIG nuclease family protein n=1 Tax=Rhodoblastus acidophilus TaxID=1074 RepID=A0A6N8DU29_RHOAC|nr:GIY-YIG nuclease family protein [Rhodoblastus acidophilus]MCW2275978.1 hypothetical protein [Rhodoblastus acidophilus]MTV32651.1 GIY-YIG nuclease family protein [Rhodoblastus acidophilus]